jgi:two-component system sensor histidine kinase KdpD
LLIERMREGDIYPPGKAERALEGYFTPANLTALRDLALRATAKEVEEKLGVYLQERKLESLPIGERIMVAIDHRPAGKALIRQGWRLAAALKGQLIAVHVDPTEDRRRPRTDEEKRLLQTNLQLAEDLGAQVVHLNGKVADELIAYAQSHHVSHLFVGHPSHGRWAELLRGSVTGDILRKAPGINLHAIGDKSTTNTNVVAVR